MTYHKETHGYHMGGCGLQWTSPRNYRPSPAAGGVYADAVKVCGRRIKYHARAIFIWACAELTQARANLTKAIAIMNVTSKDKKQKNL